MRFTHAGVLGSFDLASNGAAVTTDTALSNLNGGTLRWLDGPYAGQTSGIAGVQSGKLLLAIPLDSAPPVGTRVSLREGCDRTLETCATRFANAINFQGEPFLPGNDLITRYPAPVQ